MEKISSTLKKEAKGSKKLILWLDCDREGEHIAFEVMNECRKVAARLECLRARFSAFIPKFGSSLHWFFFSSLLLLLHCLHVDDFVVIITAAKSFMPFRIWFCRINATATPWPLEWRSTCASAPRSRASRRCVCRSDLPDSIQRSSATVLVSFRLSVNFPISNIRQQE